MDRWTDRRRLFLEEYFACNMNATEAARQAGYKFPNVLGPTLVKISIIRDAINKRLEERAMSANEVLARLGDIARADITDFIDDTGGVDFEKVKAKGQLVKEVIHQKGQRSTIKLHDAQAVLIHLDKHHGGPKGAAIRRELDVTTKGESLNVGRLTDEERIDRLAALLDAGRARRDRRDPSSNDPTDLDTPSGSTD